ncbi:alpha/beta hydrolase family protein [Nocardia altamirensis]|uniref:alpha/beta hydrolase family protein n=1 Tax=Nocardia altamirensis TaxID=472158 RepID=UPI000A062BC0|nr:prolyl oligopeptidase family serine peptidase [Nocardia altamirensis]
MQIGLFAWLKHYSSTLRTPALVLVGVLACLGIAAPAASAEQDIVQQEVTFESHGVTLHGTVFAPRADTAVPKRPGIVLVHGAGPGPRAKYVPEAEVFARAGIVTLAFDKRTDGYSLMHRDFDLLADDVLAGVATLRNRADVEPTQVGLWALSEGGWVAPLAAAAAPDLAFLVTIGASGFEPLRTQTWNLGNQLRHQGISEPLRDVIAGPGAQHMADTGLFPEAWHDPVPALERLRLPVLALWGEHDTLCPPAESAAVFKQALARAGNQHVTVRFVPEAGHTGHATTDGFDKVGGLIFNGKPLGALGPVYTETMTSWIQSVVAGRAPASSIEAVPSQADTSRAPSSGAWYEAAAVRYAALALLLIGFAGYPLSAWVGRTGRNPVRWPARGLAAAGLVAVVGTLSYLLSIFATSGEGATALVAGRTLPWLVLQISAVGVLLATAATAISWWRARDQVVGALRVRLCVLVLAGVVFIPWALEWQLLR